MDKIIDLMEKGPSTITQLFFYLLVVLKVMGIISLSWIFIIVLPFASPLFIGSFLSAIGMTICALIAAKSTNNSR